MSDALFETPHHFSITGMDPDEVTDRLKPLGIGKPRVVNRNPIVVIVQLPSRDADPQAALIEIRQLLKEDGQAQLALHDEYGNELVPTGTIQVRFVKAPSDDELNTLGESLGLKVIERNEFQPKQASFEPVDKLHADLEGDINRLEERSDVRKAWPEVRARYQRH